MKMIRNLGTLLLSVWFILAGLRGLLHIGFSYRSLNIFMDVLALAGGVLVLWAVLNLWTSKAASA
jgi:hypothetical protein